MSDDRNQQRGSKSAERKDDPDFDGWKSPDRGDDIGKALRTAYDSAVNEDVPDELLDLLGKLK